MTYEEARALIQEHLDYGGSLDSHGLAVAMSAPAAGASEGQAEPVAWISEQQMNILAHNAFAAVSPPGMRKPEDVIPLYLHPSAEIAALRERIAGMEKDAIRSLIARHAEELEQNDYAYFELAYTRRTGWMAWICSNSRDDDPNRKVIACGQGDTPNEACDAAIAKETRDA